MHVPVVGALSPLTLRVVVGTALSDGPPQSGRTVARSGLAEIELGRARCRLRVTNLTLSVARWGPSSTVPAIPEAPLKASNRTRENRPSGINCCGSGRLAHMFIEDVILSPG